MTAEIRMIALQTRSKAYPARRSHEDCIIYSSLPDILRRAFRATGFFFFESEPLHRSGLITASANESAGRVVEYPDFIATRFPLRRLATRLVSLVPFGFDSLRLFAREAY